MKTHGKKLCLLCPLLLCLLLLGGCDKAPTVSLSASTPALSLSSKMVSSGEGSLSSGGTSEPPTYYLGNPPSPELLVRNDNGTAYLPDGRYYNENGVFLSDGTKIAKIEDCTIEIIGMESVVTLPDGTRIIDPYAGGLGSLTEDSDQ